jgi:hypothetical protein
MVGCLLAGMNFLIKISSLFAACLSSVSPFVNILKGLSAGGGPSFNASGN